MENLPYVAAESKHSDARTQPKRITFEKAMHAGRDVIERVLQWPDLTEGDGRVVMVLVAQVSCFSNLADTFAHAYLAKLAGLNRKTVGVALDRLADRECITYTPGTYMGAGSHITLLASDPLLHGESRFGALVAEHTTPPSTWMDAQTAYREAVAAYCAAPSPRATGKYRNAASADTRILLALGAWVSCSSRTTASFTRKMLGDLAGVASRTVQRRMTTLAELTGIDYTPGTHAGNPSNITLSTASALDVSLSTPKRETETAREGDRNDPRGRQKPYERETSRTAIPELSRVSPSFSELNVFQSVAEVEDDDTDETLDDVQPMAAGAARFATIRSANRDGHAPTWCRPRRIA